MEEFINKWQTLIGSALGPFLAVILSAIGFWTKSAIENKNERIVGSCGNKKELN